MHRADKPDDAKTVPTAKNVPTLYMTKPAIKYNLDQLKIINHISKWYYSNQLYLIFQGPAGVGKTTVVDQILKDINPENCFILAPTNEALKQLKEKITSSTNFVFKTVHSALGIAPTVHENNLKFTVNRIPQSVYKADLIILDEASMLPSWLIEILLELKVKILFIGHSSQLPPVKENRSIFDKCVSPIFEQEFPTITLTTPVRNTGKLFDFMQLLERAIYNPIPIPTTFDIYKRQLLTYFETNTEDFISGRTKVVAWTNNYADLLNNMIRLQIYGAPTKESKYLKEDLIICTAPITIIPELENLTENLLLQFFSNISRGEENYLYANSKFYIIATETVKVKLNKELQFDCYKLKCLHLGMYIYLYTPVDEKMFETISLYYEHRAYRIKDKEIKDRYFREKHFILGCFARLKHYYAATAHRLQGATIENIIYIESNVNSNPNPIEAAKCRYVACSRTSKKLMYFRGLL